jgi:GTP cyclohydrolase IB
MKDTQGLADEREVDLQRVGIKNVDLPFRIQEKAGGIQAVLARVELSVDLPRHYKGTHMSRFVEILERWKDQPSSSGQLEHILTDTRRRLRADRAHIRVGFKYFIPKRAPVSRQVSTMGYDCEFEATLGLGAAGRAPGGGGKGVPGQGGGASGPAGYDLVVGVRVPTTTVCPCSKEISVAGAHNQRAWLRVRLRTVPGRFLWLEDLIARLESFGSCEIYPLVKRPDEKYVTEKGYYNPKFVEDVLRDVVLWLRGHPLVTWFEVECEADESIHLHNAFAYQQEPLPAALNVFVRDVADGRLPQGTYSGNGAAPAARANGKHVPPPGQDGTRGRGLPDVAARRPGRS